MIYLIISKIYFLNSRKISVLTFWFSVLSLQFSFVFQSIENSVISLWNTSSYACGSAFCCTQQAWPDPNGDIASNKSKEKPTHKVLNNWEHKGASNSLILSVLHLTLLP